MTLAVKATSRNHFLSCREANDIISNIIANIIFWGLGGFLAAWILSRRRIRKLRFWGISEDKQLIRVYLSSFTVEPDAIKDNYNMSRTEIKDGTVCLPDSEFRSIPQISHLFSSDRLGFMPEIFEGLIDRVWLWKKPEMEFIASPQTEKKPEPGCKICLGGPRHNQVTRWYLKSCLPPLTLEDKSGQGDWRIKICRGINAGTFIDFNSQTSDLGMIIRVKIREEEGFVLRENIKAKKDAEFEGDTILIAAGITDYGTRAAISYLIESWSDLQKRFKYNDFGVCIRCDPKNLETKPVVVCRVW